MSYLSRRFAWINDHESGMQGWLPESVKDIECFIPNSGGVGVAHDMLEHPKMDGTNADELLAAGHLWYGRIEPGRLAPRGFAGYFPDWHTTASQIGDTFCDADYQDIPRIRMPADPHGHLCHFNRHADVLEAKVLENMHDGVREDSDLLTVSENRTAQEVADFKLYMKAWAHDAMNWARRGILQAHRRWGAHNGEMADVFWELAGEVDKYHGDEEEAPYYPTMDIHVSIKRRSFNIVRRAHDGSIRPATTDFAIDFKPLPR
jgi:hypothetical protein